MAKSRVGKSRVGKSNVAKSSVMTWSTIGGALAIEIALVRSLGGFPQEASV